MTTERTTRGGEQRATEPTRSLERPDRARGARRDRPRGVPRKAALLAGLAAVLTGAALAACAVAPPRLHPVFPEGPAAEKPRGKILFVLSAAREQTLGDRSKRATGTFLGEFYEPYLALTGAGHEVVFATEGGAAPAIDPESLDERYWEDEAQRAEARRFVERAPQVRAPLSLKQARAAADAFDGIVVPGGQGVMVDLLDNADLHALLAHFAARDQPVGLICHAPAVLTRMRQPNPLSRRTVTSVSSFEELYIETFVMGAEAQVRDIGEQLEDHGYEHEAAFPGSAHALRDCNLVTSQNPFSTGRFSALYLEALADYRRGARCAIGGRP
ncbi:type 1 glutamine amidotransferase domain-containing protein [Sorangium sp. So ce1335]|uniref:type 1 glutamine amidotransferase domain-containing protein n=1 Tax=Sorangium sp. So ce1335 TaxID=3133335 RepID=UPI003F626501